MPDVSIYLGSGSSWLQSIIPALTGLIGAFIGAAAALGSSVINHKLTLKKELANIRRLKGEEVLTDLAELLTWGTAAITDAVDGKYGFEYPPNIFRMDAQVRLYYSKHTELMLVVFTKSIALARKAMHAGLAIKNDNKLIKEKSDEMINEIKLLIEAVEKLKKEIISELRFEYKK